MSTGGEYTCITCCAYFTSRRKFQNHLCVVHEQDSNNSGGTTSTLTFKDDSDKTSLTDRISSRFHLFQIIVGKPKSKVLQIRVKNGYEFKKALEDHSTPTAVHHISLSGTNIEFIPVSIGRFINLQTLNLNNNKIIEIPWSMIYLKHLTVLDLSNNDLPEIPSILGYLTSLKELYLSRNRLVYLPTSLLKLSHLQVLDVKENPHLLWTRICFEGKDAIFAHLMRRHDRVDVYAGTTSWYDVDWGKNVLANEEHMVVGVDSLMQMSIDCIIECQIDYTAPGHVPPLLKNFLNVSQQSCWSRIDISKCSVCYRFFTTREKFRNHDCK